MTKQQILAEIAAKIDGQGSAIDAGSALPGILREILDLIPAEQVNSDWDATEGPAEILNKPTIPEGATAPVSTITITPEENSAQNKTRSETASLLGITEEELDNIPNQLVINSDVNALTRIFSDGDNTIFGGTSSEGGVKFELYHSGENYTFYYNEI